MALSRIVVAPKTDQGGVKKSKKNFKKNIRKMEKTNFGTSGTIIAQNRFFSDRFRAQRGVGEVTVGRTPPGGGGQGQKIKWSLEPREHSPKIF